MAGLAGVALQSVARTVGLGAACAPLGVLKGNCLGPLPRRVRAVYLQPIRHVQRPLLRSLAKVLRTTVARANGVTQHQCMKRARL